MSGNCRNPKSEPTALYNMMVLANETEPMTKTKLKRMYKKITGKELGDEEAEQALKGGE